MGELHSAQHLASESIHVMNKENREEKENRQIRIDEMQLEGPEDIDIGVIQMNFAKNTVIHRAGCSPAQAVMGRQPRVPDGAAELA